MYKIKGDLILIKAARGLYRIREMEVQTEMKALKESLVIRLKVISIRLSKFSKKIS